jgi:hypothetical protein
MAEPTTKLTTVNVIKDIYSSFKKISFESDITLQKLVNRAVYKYTTDDDFRDSIHSCHILQVSGSKF